MKAHRACAACRAFLIRGWHGSERDVRRARFMAASTCAWSALLSLLTPGSWKRTVLDRSRSMPDEDKLPESRLSVEGADICSRPRAAKARGDTRGEGQKSASLAAERSGVVSSTYKSFVTCRPDGPASQPTRPSREVLVTTCGDRNFWLERSRRALRRSHPSHF